MRRVFLLACGLSALLAGCAGKVVSVTDEAGFRNLARHFAPALQARQILDSDGDWQEPLIAFASAPADAGDRLYRRLCPAFRFRAEDAPFAPATFAASWAEGDEQKITPHGFTLVQGMRRVQVSLLALVDWNSDGTDDWLVLCAVRAVQSPAGEDERDYYLLIEDPGAALIRPQVIGVYDCRNRRCAAYAGAGGWQPESLVVELLAGQRVVTVPPAKSAKNRKLDVLQERALRR
ncbi:MAG: motor neuron and pancreas homeobox protein 1 [Deltaproteobacteria bacterium]|jgi:hypothetical protein|nr:motor neuron and pancreas homeobox protein 1 [Deltaproteobacteria bacterium]